MPFHLREVCKIAHSRGSPLITSIVVNQQHLATGAMEPSSMSGFINAAHALRLPVTDEAAFVREQQKATFEWARRGGLAETHA
jgi:hypothetical protein